MTRINTNVEALRGLRNVQKANSLLSTSLQRLSTGLKINSGKDNPAGLIASEVLRLQTTTINQSITNSNRANNVISTADSALGEIGGLLNQVRGLVQEGLNVGALSEDEVQANQAQLDAALSAINRISANTTFAGDKLIDGSKAFTTFVSTADSTKLTDFRVSEALFGSSQSVDINASVDVVAEKAQLQYKDGDLSGAAVIEVGGKKGAQTLFLGGSSTVADIRTAINNVSDTTGVTARIQGSLEARGTAVAGTAIVNPAGANNSLLFTDARATSTDGANATLGGSISVVFADPGANGAAIGVSVTTDGSGNSTITVNLATDGGGAITSTADDVKTAIAGNTQAAALVNVVDEGTDDGSGVVTAIAATPLAGGTDGGRLSLLDIRQGEVSGAINVVFADPGANNSALSVAVSTAGGDYTITVSLATNGSGDITSTLDDVATLLSTDEDASALIAPSVVSGGTTVAQAFASTELSEETGTIILESAEYGSSEFVNVNVLSGSFMTYAADGSTYNNRDNGVDIGVTINGQQAQGIGLQATIRTSTLDASISFTAASNVADETATVSVTGGGALFQIGQEATSAGQLGIGIEAINTARLGGIAGKLYELGTGGGKSLLDIRAGLTGAGEKIDTANVVDIIEQALNRVSTLRGRLGAVQQNVIETNISTLGVALENISEARSQIVDTDFAIETANLQKAQILSQAGISTVSIANQTPQQVLSLLR